MAELDGNLKLEGFEINPDQRRMSVSKRDAKIIRWVAGARMKGEDAPAIYKQMLFNYDNLLATNGFQARSAVIPMDVKEKIGEKNLGGYEFTKPVYNGEQIVEIVKSGAKRPQNLEDVMKPDEKPTCRFAVDATLLKGILTGMDKLTVIEVYNYDKGGMLHIHGKVEEQDVCAVLMQMWVDDPDLWEPAFLEEVNE